MTDNEVVFLVRKIGAWNIYYPPVDKPYVVGTYISRVKHELAAEGVKLIVKPMPGYEDTVNQDEVDHDLAFGDQFYTT